MRWDIHRVKNIHPYHVPGHTAYYKTQRCLSLCILCRKYREWTLRTEIHLPVGAVIQRRSFDAYQAANQPQNSGIGRSFCFSGPYPRCRSPPRKSTFPINFCEYTREGYGYMSKEMKAHIVRLLENYSKRERQISLLHYEMQHGARITP